MRGVQIGYLIDYPHYIPQLAQWLFEQWGAILGEKTIEARIEKLKAHMNRDCIQTFCIVLQNVFFITKFVRLQRKCVA
jgi:hypothetical protein